MKNNPLGIGLACLLSFGGAYAANAATYYVAPDGSDSGSGSRAAILGRPVTVRNVEGFVNQS